MDYGDPPAFEQTFWWERAFRTCDFRNSTTLRCKSVLETLLPRWRRTSGSCFRIWRRTKFVYKRLFQLKQQCLRIGAQGVRKARCSERRCGHERRLARSWVGCFFHWILQACCQEKDEKIHFSPEMCEKKSNVHKFLQDHCNRGTKLMGNFCIDIGTNGAVSGIREEHFFKKGTNWQNWQRILGHVVV